MEEHFPLTNGSLVQPATPRRALTDHVVAQQLAHGDDPQVHQLHQLLWRVVAVHVLVSAVEPLRYRGQSII